MSRTRITGICRPIRENQMEKNMVNGMATRARVSKLVTGIRVSVK